MGRRRRNESRQSHRRREGMNRSRQRNIRRQNMRSDKAFQKRLGDRRGRFPGDGLLETKEDWQAEYDAVVKLMDTVQVAAMNYDVKLVVGGSFQGVPNIGTDHGATVTVVATTEVPFVSCDIEIKCIAYAVGVAGGTVQVNVPAEFSDHLTLDMLVDVVEEWGKELVATTMATVNPRLTDFEVTRINRVDQDGQEVALGQVQVLPPAAILPGEDENGEDIEEEGKQKEEEKKEEAFSMDGKWKITAVSNADFKEQIGMTQFVAGGIAVMNSGDEQPIVKEGDRYLLYQGEPHEGVLSPSGITGEGNTIQWVFKGLDVVATWSRIVDELWLAEIPDGQALIPFLGGSCKMQCRMKWLLHAAKRQIAGDYGVEKSGCCTIA